MDNARTGRRCSWEEIDDLVSDYGSRIYELMGQCQGTGRGDFGRLRRRAELGELGLATFEQALERWAVDGISGPLGGCHKACQG